MWDTSIGRDASGQFFALLAFGAFVLLALGLGVLWLVSLFLQWRARRAVDRKSVV